MAKFCDFKQRQNVRGKSRALKGTNYYINEQFPPEINSERKELVKVMKEKKSKDIKQDLCTTNCMWTIFYTNRQPSRQTRMYRNTRGLGNSMLCHGM